MLDVVTQSLAHTSTRCSVEIKTYLDFQSELIYLLLCNTCFALGNMTALSRNVLFFVDYIDELPEGIKHLQLQREREVYAW